jgi:type I restriction enzyme S subunit
MTTANTTATDWQETFVSDCVTPFEIERVKKILAREYKSAGKFPIIDQGQQLVAGYTDDDSAVVREALPLVVFGDHTRVFKFVDFPFVVGADGTKLLKPKRELDPKFFYFACLSLDIPTRGYNRHFKILREQTIRYPEKSEQEKIAAVLWKIQKAVEIEDAIVRNARQLKKSLLRRLFTHGLRGEPLKETEIGPSPQSWVEVTIGSLGEIVTGTTPPTANRKFYDGGEFQFIAPADLGQTPFIYTAEKKITQQGLAVSRVLPKHSVCFVCIGSSIGKVGVTVEEVSATNQQINSVIVNSDYDPLFVGYLFEFKSSYIASFTSPSPVPILSKGKFEEIKLFVSPDKDEQREIADILQTVDRKIDIHESKKRSLQDLFKTTLHKLMTAQIRVNDLDIDTSEVSA